MTQQLNGQLKELIQSNPKLLKKMKKAKKNSLKELKLAKEYIHGFMDSIEQKYENLVWYARKPGNLKQSTILNDDLSIEFPKDLEFFKKNKDKLDNDDKGNAWEKAYAKFPEQFEPMPFEEWSQEGEGISGFKRYWPDGNYHQDIVQGALQELKNVEKKYPDECKQLNNEEEGQFEHGFNSGCLAIVRHIRAIIEEDEDAIGSFPQLDT